MESLNSVENAAAVNILIADNIKKACCIEKQNKEIRSLIEKEAELAKELKRSKINADFYKEKYENKVKRLGEADAAVIHYKEQNRLLKIKLEKLESESQNNDMVMELFKKNLKEKFDVMSKEYLMRQVNWTTTIFDHNYEEYVKSLTNVDDPPVPGPDLE